MLQTYEALLEPNGHIQFLEAVPATPTTVQRVLVTFTEAPEPELCGMRLSEPALAEDWLNEQEDAAWAHLQAGKLA